jgi:hypothetical protein
MFEVGPIPVSPAKMLDVIVKCLILTTQSNTCCDGPSIAKQLRLRDSMVDRFRQLVSRTTSVLLHDGLMYYC